MTKQKRILSLTAAVIMTSTSLTATGVYASDVSHEHDCGIDSYAQELMEQEDQVRQIHKQGPQGRCGASVPET